MSNEDYVGRVHVYPAPFAYINLLPRNICTVSIDYADPFIS